MSMEEIIIGVDNIDDAAERIIAFLESTRSADVIYFDGWYGLGASAVLKAVVKRLRSSSPVSATWKAAGLDKVIHIDCSLWQSKRALQKAIVEELSLSWHVKALFDQHDEEDDFDRVDQASRGVIPIVKEAIFRNLATCRYLVVFHNGSGSYIDLWECGVPLMGVMSKRVLWTSRGRFQHRNTRDEAVKGANGLSHHVAILPVAGDADQLHLHDCFMRLLYAEAEEVARYTGIPEPDMSPKVVLDCFLYMALRNDEYGTNWAFHAPNYWVCDGIIQGTMNGGRSAWEIGDALHRIMSFGWDQDLAKVVMCEALLSGEEHWSCSEQRWFSATGQNAARVQVPPEATSFFWSAATPITDNDNNVAIIRTENILTIHPLHEKDVYLTMTLEGRIFGHSNRSKLHVIHLSHCTFSFSCPPFWNCSNLRFLLLDHCKDKDATNHSGEESSHQNNNLVSFSCFMKLWVLELSYTNWSWLLSEEMMDLMADLRELNVKGASSSSMSHIHCWSGAGSNSHRLLKLQVIEESEDTVGAGGDRNHEASPVVKILDLSSCRILKTVVLDGCIFLEQVGTNALPPTLESFCFVSNNAHAKMMSMSFQGCTRLRNLYLRGLLRRLEEINLSSTAVKTLDFSLLEAQGLKRLFMLGCEELRAILWPKEKGKKIKLEVLQIDTTYAAEYNKQDTSKKQEEGTSHNKLVGSSSTTVHVNCRPLTHLGSSCIIFVRDARLFRSLQDNKIAKALNVEVSTTGNAGYNNTSHQETNSSASSGEHQMPTVSLQRAANKLYVDDVFATTFKDNLQFDHVKWMWDCPLSPAYKDWVGHCYIRIQDTTPTGQMKRTSSTKQETSATTTLPGFVAQNAVTLHVHDCLSITCIPGPVPGATIDLTWRYLTWCLLERCPNLEGTIFTAPSPRQDKKYSAFWAHYFSWLSTFWASQLLKARYIWDWTASRSTFGSLYYAFRGLVFLHLDYCPRLVHVLPLYTSNGSGCRGLETLEIVCCGELREVFPMVNSESQQQEAREFPNLKRIHLYELPLLQHICGRRMSAPKLETVKIRGCWSLRSLPSVGRPSGKGSTSLPMVDCEKDWWDGLEWDGLEDGHHPSLYRTAHSAYYKKILRRSTVLR